MKTEYSIVVPVYKNAASLVELCHLLTDYLQPISHNFEIIFINDASPDNSLEVIKQIKEINPYVVLIDNTQNIGQNRSILKGIEHSKGDKIIVMDADLQDNPALLPLLIEKLQKGRDAVFVKRKGQYQSTLRMGTSRLFKSILYHLIGLEKTAGTFFIIEKQVGERILNYNCPHPHVPSMVAHAAIHLDYVEGKRDRRKQGNSAYSTLKRLRYAWFTLRCALYLRFLHRK